MSTEAAGRRALRGLGENGWIALGGMATLLLFGGRALGWGASGGAPLSVLTYPELSAASSWAPLAAEVARGTLLPAAPSLGTGAQGFAFLPWLSVWAQGLLVALFGVDGATAVGGGLGPALAFVLMAKLYRRDLPLRWAMALPALGLVAWSGWPLRAFLGAVLSGGIEPPTAPGPPDAALMPMPALSLPLFLATLGLSLQRRRLTRRRRSLLTVAWAAQSQVHAVHAAVGLPFWFVALALGLRRQERPTTGRLLGLLAVQGAIAAAVCLPALLGWLPTVLDGDLAFLGWGAAGEASLVGGYWILAWFALPLGLLGARYAVDRVDRYELLFRFWPVFTLMAVELALVLGKRLLGVGIPPELIFDRLGMYFLHLYYFVPALYYGCRPDAAFAEGREGTPWATRLRRLSSWALRDASFLVLPLLGLVLLAYGGTGVLATGSQGAQAARDDRAARAELAALTEGAPAGATLVGSRPSVDLRLPLEGRFGSLLVNRFCNRIPQDEALARLVLYARLQGWGRAQLEALLAPGDLAAVEGPLDLRGPTPGLGTWLVAHRSVPDADAAAPLLERAEVLRKRMDLAEALRSRGVARVALRGPPPQDLPLRRLGEAGGATIYEVLP